MIQSTASADHIEVSFQLDLKVIPMPMYDEIREGVDGKILCGMDIMNISVKEEHKPVKQLLHDALEGIFVTIQKTAVATCTVIHIFASLV